MVDNVEFINREDDHLTQTTFIKPERGDGWVGTWRQRVLTPPPFTQRHQADII
jgi:hypothetical protein